MKKLISIAVVLALLVLPIALATDRRSGDISLTWTNSPERPQQFDGTVTGSLCGGSGVTCPISLVSTTDYDDVTTSNTVGVTHATVTTTLWSISCEGFYAGSNVDLGHNSGTFTLLCANGNMVNGMIYGQNDESGNINGNYDAFIVTPTPGPKGDTGTVGAQGPIGLTGATGETGAQGLKGDTGAQGLPGVKGDKGDKGDQGVQGIQGVPGAVGAVGPQGIQGIAGTNATVDLTPINNKLTYLDSVINSLFSYWPSFFKFYNVPPAIKEDCSHHKVGLSCSNSNDKYTVFMACQSGHGTKTSCDVGYCYKNSGILSEKCQNGCDPVTLLCR